MRIIRNSIIILLVFLALVLGGLMYINRDPSITIDCCNFPDEILRQKISNIFDKDKDGTLSYDEIEQAKSLDLRNDRGLSKILNFQGVRYLRNLASIQVTDGTVELKQELAYLENLQTLRLDCYIAGQTIDLSHNQNLKKLYISEGVKRVDFSKLPNLEEVSVNILAMDENVVIHLPKIQKISLYARGPSSVLIEECPNLHEVFMDADQKDSPSSVKIKNCAKVEKIQLQGRYINSIAVNQLDNLKSFEIKNNEEIKEICFENLPKFQAINLESVENLQTIKFDSIPNLLMLKIVENYAMKKLDLSFHKKLQHIYIENMDALEELNLSGTEDVSKLEIYDSELSSLIMGDISRLKEIYLRRLENLQNINFSNAQSVEKVEISEVPNLYLATKNLTSVKELVVSDNRKMRKLDLRAMQGLEKLSWEHGSIRKISWGKKEKLQYISVFNNKLTGEFNVEKFPVLETLCCDNNKIESISAETQNLLARIECQDNVLQTIRLRSAHIRFMDCTKNPNVKIYLGKKPQDLGEEGGSNYFYDDSAKVYWAGGKLKRK